MFRPETLSLLIPLVALVGYFITKWLRINVEAGCNRGHDTLAVEMRAAIDRLEARVANLERAVTTAETERTFTL
jgi:hypothetical protein